MPSFWVEPEDVDGPVLFLRGDEAHHLQRVRRIHPGERIRAVDGSGHAYAATVAELAPDAVRCRIEERYQEWGESPIRLCLAAALLKGQRFDLVVEKATEIGVDSIRPVLSSRAVSRGAREGRFFRWQRIARAAVKQCDRCRLPAIYPPAVLEEVVEALACEGRALLLAVPGESEIDLEQILASREGRPLALFIGPEGGYSSAEKSCIRDAGGVGFSWGHRVLRAETACVALSAVVLHAAQRNSTDAGCPRSPEGVGA